jgi:hypothetical protein
VRSAGGCNVAAFSDDHFVVDLDEQGTHETDDLGLAGEDPDDIGASF